MKQILVSLTFCFLAFYPVKGDTIQVNSFRYAGPYELTPPLQIDSLNAQKQKYDPTSLLDAPISLDLLKSQGEDFSGIQSTSSPSFHLVGFTMDNNKYLKGELKIEGVKQYQYYIDGEKGSSGEFAFSPATRDVVIKCLTDSSSTDSLRVSIITERPEYLTINPDLKDGYRYTTRNIFTGPFMRYLDISPSGKYLYYGKSFTGLDGVSSQYQYSVTDLATGNNIYNTTNFMRWMPKSDKLTYVRKRNGKNQLVSLDPTTSVETILAKDLPETNYIMSPTEDYLILFKTEEGRKEKQEGLYQIINPEDRQPGWRNRGQLIKYDLSTGISTPLTFGNTSAHFCGLTDDGKKLLFMTSHQRFTSRPTTLMSVYLLDLDSMTTEKLIENDGFISTVSISPDGKTLVITGSPESLGGVGNVLPPDRIPSMIDNQLYVMDIKTRKITPLTRDFNPSIVSIDWNNYDNHIYFIAEDRDMRRLFRVNPKSGKIENLRLPEEYVMNFSLASDASVGAYYGESVDTSYRMYTFNTKTLKPTLFDDLNQERTANVNIVPTYDWNYVTSRGDTISARYNLPADFEEGKKYPMIVYYYGGCSPTARSLDTTYNPHLFSANGFIFLVINPSGATGFGQEFSSRHVATAGEGVAQDIIEGVKQFSKEMPFVDSEKIGCVGASYGGFMTQYLQTVTDIFAAAISHAGISDHTSYWGEGYWGYSYSEVSMGDRYPWNDKELYVEHSPLYNADKINTPILFLHGDADTNVPVGESIQMFTALKLLGKETAFVAVKDTNHWVQDFDKREHWLNTMLAWFTKYLYNDSTWWNDMYEE